MTDDSLILSSYSDRRRVESKHQLGSLRIELEEWRGVAAPGGALAKHHSQVASLAHRLTIFATEVENRIAGDPGISASHREKLILDSHAVWDYFRNKLLPRFVPWHREFLQAADEFTWACYRPAFRERSTGPGRPIPKGPPLVFLNRVEVPFAQARGGQFTVPNLQAVKDGQWSSFLPFPLVGLPWFAIQHLPILLHAAHEVGHQIEDDLDLTESLQECVAMAGVGAPWRRWIGEVFADVCGCLFAGEAYAGVLLDALATRADTLGMGNYPRAQLRLQVCIAVLDRTGFGRQAARLQAEWKEHWPSEHLCVEAVKLVETLLSREFDELPKRTLVDSLGCAQLSDLAAPADNLLRYQQTDLTDPRAVVAAAGLAFRRSPLSFDDAKVGPAAVAEVRSLMDRLHRGDGPPADTEEMMRLRDETAGRRLFETIVGSYPDIDFHDLDPTGSGGEPDQGTNQAKGTAIVGRLS